MEKGKDPIRIRITQLFPTTEKDMEEIVKDYTPIGLLWDRRWYTPLILFQKTGTHEKVFITSTYHRREYLRDHLHRKFKYLFG